MSTDKYDFPGKKLWYWDENTHQPFVEHFQTCHIHEQEVRGQ